MKTGLDNDEDGLVDCANPQCSFKCSTLSYGSDYKPLSDFIAALNDERDFMDDFIANHGLPQFENGMVYQDGENRGNEIKTIVCPVQKTGYKEISGLYMGRW